jgi:hypothetical protein
MQEWEQRDIVFCVGGSLIVVDIAFKYLKYYFWHGYKLREIPTEVSIFGFFKLDLGQDFVEPAHMRLDFSCENLFYTLCFCCLSAEQRERKRKEAIDSTTNYYQEQIAALARQRGEEVEREERFQDARSDCSTGDIGNWAGGGGGGGGVPQGADEENGRPAFAAAGVAVDAVAGGGGGVGGGGGGGGAQASTNPIHRHAVTGQEQRQGQAPAGPLPDDVARQEDEIVLGIHTRLWEVVWAMINDDLSPISALLLYDLQVSTAEQLGELNEIQARLFANSLHRRHAAELKSIRVDDLNKVLRLSRYHALWQRIKDSLSPFERELVCHRPPVRSAFDLVKCMQNTYVSNRLCHVAPSHIREGLKGAIVRMKVWNMQWSVFQQDLIVLRRPFAVVPREAMKKVAPEIEMMVLNSSDRHKNTSSSRNATTNPIQGSVVGSSRITYAPNSGLADFFVTRDCDHVSFFEQL